MKIRKSLLVVAIGWLVFVTILLCIPGTELPKVTWSTKIWLDKWVHIFLFLVLVWFWCRAYKSMENTKAKKTFIAITILSILYGVIMEIIQHYFIPFRSFDAGDMIADSIGAIAGYFISIKRFLKKN